MKRPHPSLRGQTRVSQRSFGWMLESRAERSALGAAPDVSVVDVGLQFHVQKPN